MAKHQALRAEVILAGIGGMGVVSAGQILLRAGSRIYDHVSYVPVYGYAMRGGLCECTVILSRDMIRSPLLDQAQAVLLLDSSQFASFESRVRPGGLIIAEKTGLPEERGREDYKLYSIPGLEIAINIGSTVVNNFILLGAYVSLTGEIDVKLIEAEIRKRYKDDEKAFGRNQEAFERGLELGKTAK